MKKSKKKKKRSLEILWTDLFITNFFCLLLLFPISIWSLQLQDSCALWFPVSLTNKFSFESNRNKNSVNSQYVLLHFFVSYDGIYFLILMCCSLTINISFKLQLKFLVCLLQQTCVVLYLQKICNSPSKYVGSVVYGGGRSKGKTAEVTNVISMTTQYQSFKCVSSLMDFIL